MTPYEVIRDKRDGKELAPEVIQGLVQNYTSGLVSDEQMAAFCMAVYFRGLNFRETTDLTLSMRDSGSVVDLSRIGGVKVDKHSTGGVGDKISLVLAPLAASLGVVVPMVSGRGLGHTGGTLDKLESIPGFRVNLSTKEFVSALSSIGVCMIGQTDEIAPADRKLYALRDVTATVESVPLIAASIMSKKLASGLDSLVLDVKVGRGAFMKSLEEAMVLARYLVEIGENAGKRVTAVLTNMDEPLGRCIGNWLEVEESIEIMHGQGPVDVTDLTVALCVEMMLLAGIATDREAAVIAARRNLENGAAWRKFLQMVELQGGSLSYLHDKSLWRKAKFSQEVNSNAEGFVVSIDTLEIGLTSVAIGAGRMRKEDRIDPLAGLVLHKKVGDRVRSGESLVSVHCESLSVAKQAIERIRNAYHIDWNAPNKKSLIYSIVNRGALQTH